MSNASREKRFYRLFVIFSMSFAVLIILFFAYRMLFSRSSTKKYSDPVISSTCQRGNILDRNGEIIATSIPYLMVIANPRQIVEKESSALKLSQILGVPYETVLSSLSVDSGYRVLKRKIDSSQYDSLKSRLSDAGLLGPVYIQRYDGRFYPSGFHGAQIIGFTDVDGNGIEGIEMAFDSILKAYPTVGRETSVGNDVYLTIDMQLQYLCDSVIQTMCEEHDPDYAVLILQDARTGEILSSVSYPWYNPNNYNLSTEDSLQNKAFAFMYEPGSVFKIFSLAACLEAGTADFTTEYECTGSRTFVTDSRQSVTITCHEPHGVIDYEGMIAKSCNGAISNWALQTSNEEFYNGLEDFHFSTEYDIPLFNASGSLSSPENWSYRSKSTISFGQEMMATPLQLANAATVFTNQGILLEPQLILKTVSQDGIISNQAKRTELNQTVSAETASKVLLAMKKATEKGGTAIKTSVAGLEVAAKTGTAEILNSDTGAVTASTLAVFPADDPMYIVYIAASNPKGSTIWGANIASPAIGNLIDDMVSAGKLKSLEYKLP